VDDESGTSRPLLGMATLEDTYGLRRACDNFPVRVEVHVGQRDPQPESGKTDETVQWAQQQRPSNIGHSMSGRLISEDFASRLTKWAWQSCEVSR
jgi:hypothetical protein